MNTRASGTSLIAPALEPGGVHPYLWPVMTEMDVSLHGQYSKSVDQYLGRVHFARLITVCSKAEENCPSVFPGVAHREHWPFENPAAFEGTTE